MRKCELTCFLVFQIRNVFQLLNELGVLEYMVYADKKLEEEQQRAKRYLEMNSPTSGKHMEKAVIALVESFEDTILAECSKLIASKDVERKFCICSNCKNVFFSRSPTSVSLDS